MHLLKGVKNTGIQPALIKVLPSGVGVFLSPFKDVWVLELYLLVSVKYSLELTRINRENLNMRCTLCTTQISWGVKLIVMLRGALGLILKVR